ncbi:hypothetical protein M407DRAFT_191683 [Tulasnella calospora MUT 4182]|uniref:NmrA-like domain-containing protein n=1 Tax=Tulasnella calospora MUT 4182 TaxID=1051891 RepID=A0A0C3QJP8_9AGAM|nr:hypothetical protein M407DRAFT_191683 [Tulasnella calospora MUT 4182]
MSSSSINVVVAGGTGHLGKLISKTLLSPVYRPGQINRVVVLSRDDSSSVAQELKALGAEIHTGPVQADTLKGIDVVINAWGFMVPGDIKNALVRAAVDAGVKVYFPSEFGVDPRTLDVEAKIFASKVEQTDYAREVGKGALKVVEIYNGGFLGQIAQYAPAVGIDIPNKTVTSVGQGSATARVTFTSERDIAYSTVRFAILAAQDPSSVADKVCISGTNASWSHLAELLSKEVGTKFEVKELDDAPLRKKIEEGDFIAALRYAYGKGHVDLTTGQTSNELVNPGQELWKWETVEEYVKKTNGLSPA